MRNAVIPTFLAVLVLCVTFVPVATTEADAGNGILIDNGNGDYDWISPTGTGSYLDVVSQYEEVTVMDGHTKINGMGYTSITGTTTVSCDWKIYIWEGGSWKYIGSDLSVSYNGGYAALGLFSHDSMIPAATPDEMTVWTQLGGSSSSAGISDSYGPNDPALPVEWYQTYTTGYVDSGLVVADRYLYHTTGGTYGASGTDADPWIYCLDRYTGEIVWRYHGTYGAGYEVTTPVIAGNFLIVTTTGGDLYVFDRYNGDILDTISIPYSPPINEDGDIVWNGRTFVTGGTTPVYDSGALFFGSADGKVYCYDISSDGILSEVWCYDPPATVDASGNYTGSKGCFYYHAPTVAEIDGKRILYIGNYEGYIHALDVTTGNALWVRQVINLEEDNTCVPGTPGSVGSLTVNPDGSMIMASCSDGGLFTLYGYLLGLDPLTGDTIMRENGTEWKIEALFTPPVCTKDGFYTYVSAASSGTDTLTTAEGPEMEITPAIYMFDWSGNVIWTSSDYQMIKASLTLAGNVLYSMDYSAGSFWPTGGALTAVSAEDGSELWRVLLSPYTTDSYSMVQPTVIDGKIYVANDLGAVYCLSETAGEGTEEEMVEMLYTQGFHHWSWAFLLLIAIIAIILLIRLY